MTQALEYVYHLAAAVLVGKIVLLSFIVAPVLAKTLEPEPFGRVVRRLFPSYYRLGMIAAAFGSTACVGLMLLQGADATLLALTGLWLAVFLVDGYCRSPLTPTLNSLRDQVKQQESLGLVDPHVKAHWESLHRRSVYLNTAILLIGLVLIIR